MCFSAAQPSHLATCLSHLLRDEVVPLRLGPDGQMPCRLYIAGDGMFF